MTVAEFFAMGKHAAYVWPSYGIAFLSIAGYVLYILYVGKQVRKSLLRRIEVRRKENESTA